MKKFFVVLAVCALVAMALPLSSQQTTGLVPAGIYGHLDPRTGIFTPGGLLPADITGGTEETPPPLTTFTGKFVVNFTITISSAVPTGTTIACNAAVTVVDATGQLSDSQAASAVRNGSTATCSVSVPYSWPLTASSDTVYVNFDISAPPQPLVSSSTFPRRYSARPISKITVPVNGATTTYNIVATI